MDEQSVKKIKQNMVDFRILDMQLNVSPEALNFALFKAMEIKHDIDFIVYLLKKKNLNINMKMGKEEDNYTLLHQAIDTSQPIKLIKFLIKQGACLNAQDGFGRTPLYLAAVFRARKAIALLLKYGADVDTKDILGNTPLHRAVELDEVGEKEETLVNLLLQYGANPYTEGEKGFRPIDVASKSDVDSQRMTKLLQANILFKNPDAEKPEGMTSKNSEQWDALVTELDRMKNVHPIWGFSMYSLCTENNLNLVLITSNEAHLISQLKISAEKFPLFTFQINSHLPKVLEALQAKNVKYSSLKNFALFNLPKEERNGDLSVAGLSVSDHFRLTS
ncbi:ankyrin repeat domain-containing protein [Rickettsiella endosymbiont of Xylota segnis]|uniref:ankyrin repeat domain-containing protein n=1 Tax=Rickettsiella endosymbiont of Xylota segnis TaxID=3066238 RepID=UPI0030D22D2F